MSAGDEVSRPYEHPDTPEWREADKAMDEWIESMNDEELKDESDYHAE